MIPQTNSGCQTSQKTKQKTLTFSSREQAPGLGLRFPSKAPPGNASIPLATQAVGPGGTAFFLASEKAGFSRRYTSRTGLRRTRDGSHGRALQVLVSLLLLLVADLWIAYAAKGDKPNSTRWAPFAAASIVGGVHDDLYQRSGSWARRRTFPRPRRTTGVRALSTLVSCDSQQFTHHTRTSRDPAVLVLFCALGAMV